jgi:protein disulfide-isomerase A1
MHRITLCLFITLALLNIAFSEDSDVLVLDSSNFQNTIQENALIAVEFYAPWCGHCKSLAPEWEKAATALKGKVTIAKVDCTAEGSICEEHGVQGYPTLKLFRNGEPSPLEVARKAEPIIAYLTAELEPAVTVLKNKEDIDAFLAAHPIAALGYFDNDHDDRYKAFDQIASTLRHTTSFGAIINTELSPEITRPAIIFHRNFDEPTTAYSGEYTSSDINTWIARQKIPALGEISQETYQNYMGSGLPVGYLFINPDIDNKDLLDSVKEIAKKVKDHLVLAWIDNNKYGRHGVRMGLSGKTVPSFAVDNAVSGTRFLFPESDAFSAESLQKWFDRYLANEIEPHVKSEPIPEDNSGPVKVVVAHTFQSIVKDASKDVLVEFYAPWCGHCKKLAPIWDELGEAYASSPNVVIAKIDATANDVPPQLNIRGFPTILFFTSGNKDKPIEYQGSRQLDDFKRFISQHTGASEETTEDHAHNEHDEL